MFEAHNILGAGFTAIATQRYPTRPKDIHLENLENCRKMTGPNHGRGLPTRASASLALL